MRRSTFLYDFSRTIRSKTVIIFSLILILLSSVVVYSIKVSTTPAFYVSYETEFLAYHAGDDYKLYLFIHDNLGDPAKNSIVKMNITDISAKPERLLLELENRTDERGMTTFRFSRSYYNESAFNMLFITCSSPDGRKLSSLGISVSSLESFYEYPSGNITGYRGITLVNDPNDFSSYNILVFFVPEDGSKPNVNVYYRYWNASSKPGEWQLLGVLDDYYKVFDAKLKFDYVAIVEAKFSYGNKTYSNQISIFPQTPLLNVDPLRLVYSAITSFFSFFVALMAILAGYNLYGKDKIQGVLEYVISKPITRLGLAVSRYASIILALSLAILGSFIVANFYIAYFLGKWISLSYLIPGILSLIVEAAAFLGIVLALSNFLKSTGTLIAIAIVLFIIFSFLWGLIVLLISFAMGINLLSLDFLRLSVIMNYFNPAQYPDLVNQYVVGTITAIGMEVPLSPAEYGITIPNLVIAGLAWSIIPLIIFLYFSKKRD